MTSSPNFKALLDVVLQKRNPFSRCLAATWRFLLLNFGCDIFSDLQVALSLFFDGGPPAPGPEIAAKPDVPLTEW